MRRCAQSSQRSTWPPNAAVRQRSIADMTLSWPRLTWPAWDARQAGPRWRKMSATSTAGRDNGRASAGHLPQKGERASHRADRADGDAGVERRRVEFLMSQQHLNHPHVDIALQQMGGERVAQRVRRNPAAEPRGLRRHVADAVELAHGYW